MTPQDVLVEFETSRTAPVAAMRAALDSREEMLPAFLAEFERATEIPWQNLPHTGAYAIMLEILGEWADPRSYLTLARFFRLDSDTLELLIGDGITESVDRVMAGVATEDLTPIFDIILDPNADLFIRSGMITALLRIAAQSPERLPAVVGFIETFRSRVEPDVNPYLFGEWAFTVAALGLEHLEPDVRATITAFPSDIACYTMNYFEDDLRKSEEDPFGAWVLRGSPCPTAINAVEEVSRWYCYSEKYLRQLEQEEADQPYQPAPWQDPDIAFNPYRDVGRNDPCPCGSGKKFKKCCLN
jgi:hypothetical protein